MSIPLHIGRYEVLGELATGGMAEILLGRLTGPSGFERPVVIKRILPHLARRKEFEAMFLDEARTVARIRHPNVVQVQELGQQDGELYLVMEYLEGETAASLTKRLLVRDRTLDPGLAAFIVAETCAGLHAAHELTDDDGTKQHLVHRDVSPQNVFLTYGGDVKVIDFGVAKVADRIARTEVGQVKGKFEYMSPEQCGGGDVDLRSDVFALGILLYELGTMRRLFKRFNALLSMKAIREDPILPPSRVAAHFPSELEAVCLRALARKRDDRFGSAAEMRRELLTAARPLIGAHAEPNEQLAALMSELFADRIAEKRDLLRTVRSGANVSHVPAAETDTAVDLPGLPDEAAGTTDTEVSSSVDAPRPSTRRYGVWALGAAAAISTSIGLTVVLRRGTSKRPTDLPSMQAAMPALPPAANPAMSTSTAPTEAAPTAPAASPPPSSNTFTSAPRHHIVRPRSAAPGTSADRATRMPSTTAPGPAPAPSNGFHRF